MIIPTVHFGEVEIDETKIITFEDGLPGLEEDRRFALLTTEESRPIGWLQSLDHAEVVLPVIDPFLLCPDYAFDVCDEDLEKLDLRDIHDAFVLSVLVIPRETKDMTVNLAAPVVINARNGRGRQIILDDKKYKVRVPVARLLEEAAQKTGQAGEGGDGPCSS